MDVDYSEGEETVGQDETEQTLNASTENPVQKLAVSKPSFLCRLIVASVGPDLHLCLPMAAKVSEQLADHGTACSAITAGIEKCVP